MARNTRLRPAQGQANQNRSVAVGVARKVPLSAEELLTADGDRGRSLTPMHIQTALSSLSAFNTTAHEARRVEVLGTMREELEEREWKADLIKTYAGMKNP